MQLGLIGKSLKHSFSKKYFAEKFSKLDLHCHSYSSFELSTIDEFTGLLQNTPRLTGLNVTIPYKTAIIPYLDFLSAEAEKINAVNTIKVIGGKLYGYNTDVYGFTQSIKPLLKPAHRKALILGTGGASKAVAYSLNKLGIDYTKVSRNPNSEEIGYDEASINLKDYQVVVNTTPLGTYPNLSERPLLSGSLLTENHLIYDLVYNPEKTAFLDEAEKKGATIKNGYEMLVLQAEKAWEIWNEV